jgi:poly(3-hydroxybutyrate) depolymerase
MMLYALHETQRALMGPWTGAAGAMARMFSEPGNGWSQLPGASQLAAGSELMYRLGKDYEKPSFDIHRVEAHGREVAVLEQVALELPFCRLLHFARYSNDAAGVAALHADPAVLLVAPLSGHHATLLRDTVKTLLRDHDVYITDWTDARMVPLEHGAFHLDDYVDYIRQFIGQLGAETLHVVSVCQPTVPVLAAVSLMASAGETTPRTLTLMGGPIDTRCNPTRPDDLATQHPLDWFRHTVIQPVPANYPGRGRLVYPGFLQHAGFVAMNPGHHLFSHWDFYRNLARGYTDDADAHRRFYDDYNAVLDMAAEFYLDTIDVVFQRHLLPKGEWSVRGDPVRPQDIRRTALLTVEGERDDISGLGQTEAAHALCSGIPRKRKRHLLAPDVGHYGIFSGRRWRDDTYPHLRAFIRAHHEL